MRQELSCIYYLDKLVLKLDEQFVVCDFRRDTNRKYG